MHRRKSKETASDYEQLQDVRIIQQRRLHIPRRHLKIRARCRLLGQGKATQNQRVIHGPAGEDVVRPIPVSRCAIWTCSLNRCGSILSHRGPELGKDDELIFAWGGRGKVVFPKQMVGWGEYLEDWRSSSRVYGMYGIHRLSFWEFWDGSCLSLIGGTN